MPRQSGFASILIVLLLATGMLGSGFFIYQKYSGVSSSQPIIIPSPTPQQKACTLEAKLCPDGSSVGRTGPNCEFSACPAQESTASSDISTWKTYTNTKHNFSLKYPSNGYVQSDNGSSVHFANNYNLETGVSSPPYFIFDIDITENKNHLTTEQVAEKKIEDVRNDQYNLSAKTQADKMSETAKEYRNNQINGIKLATFFEGYPSGTGEILMAEDDFIYDFRIHDGNGNVGAEEEKMLDQILSTFKFLP